MKDSYEGENKIPIRDVCQLHPRGVSYSTVHRWCAIGLCHGRIRLESWKEGGERFTTVEAYRRFVERLNNLKS